ncbi:hypothetical protein [Mesorhizobium sp.]|uniref:hypothetical protein n=1 Tax=Mesorhizobium sp. TaxID=1871066 RepID=UPI00257AA579|nr:hypothetical protein [Mesorhizobium sp.]
MWKHTPQEHPRVQHVAMQGQKMRFDPFMAPDGTLIPIRTLPVSRQSIRCKKGNQKIVPAIFLAHWRKAIDAGDASGFTNAEDASAFFDATSNSGCLLSLTDAQRGNVANLRSRPALANLFTASAQLRHARANAAEGKQAAATAPRFIGASAAGRPAPTLQQLRPEIEAINGEVAEVDPWAKAVAKTNAKFGFTTERAE